MPNPEPHPGPDPGTEPRDYLLLRRSFQQALETIDDLEQFEKRHPDLAVITREFARRIVDLPGYRFVNATIFGIKGVRRPVEVIVTMQSAQQRVGIWLTRSTSGAWIPSIEGDNLKMES